MKIQPFMNRVRNRYLFGCFHGLVLLSKPIVTIYNIKYKYVIIINNYLDFLKLRQYSEFAVNSTSIFCML